MPISCLSPGSLLGSMDLECTTGNHVRDRKATVQQALLSRDGNKHLFLDLTALE